MQRSEKGKREIERMDCVVVERNDGTIPNVVKPVFTMILDTKRNVRKRTSVQNATPIHLIKALQNVPTVGHEIK